MAVFQRSILLIPPIIPSVIRGSGFWILSDFKYFGVRHGGYCPHSRVICKLVVWGPVVRTLLLNTCSISVACTSSTLRVVAACQGLILPIPRVLAVLRGSTLSKYFGCLYDTADTCSFCTAYTASTHSTSVVGTAH